MHAVLAPSGGAPTACPPGFEESGIGVLSPDPVSLLILFLRLVDSAAKGDLTPAALDLEVLDLQIPGPGRPPEYIRDPCPVFVPEHEYGSSTSRSTPTTPRRPPDT